MRGEETKKNGGNHCKSCQTPSVDTKKSKFKVYFLPCVKFGSSTFLVFFDFLNF